MWNTIQFPELPQLSSLVDKNQARPLRDEFLENVKDIKHI